MGVMHFGGLYLITASLTFYLCYEIGEAESPDYDSVQATQVFVLANAKVREVKPGVIVASLRAGWTDYAYVYPQETLIEKPMLKEMAKNYKPPTRWRSFEWEKVGGILGIAALTKGGFIKTAKDIMKGSKRDLRTTLVLSIGVMSGGFVGYYVGHTDRRDYNSKNFKKGVASKQPWDILVGAYEECVLKLKFHRAFAKELDDGSDLRKFSKEFSRREYNLAYKDCTSTGQLIIAMPETI